MPLWLSSEDLLFQHCFYTSTNGSSWSQCLRHQQGQLPSLASAKRTDRLVPEHAVCAGEVSVGKEGSRHCRSATGLSIQGCQSCVHAVRLDLPAEYRDTAKAVISYHGPHLLFYAILTKNFPR